MHHWMQWLIYYNTPVRWLACLMTGFTSLPLRTTVYTGLMNSTNGSPSRQKQQKIKKIILSPPNYILIYNPCALAFSLWSTLSYLKIKMQSSSIVNQDCVENHFCQVRSCNGQNDNPTFLQQQSTQNSIRLGQTTISPKSNASCQSSNNNTRPSIAGSK